MELDLTEIRTDGGTQPRAQLDGVTVSEYADAMRRGNDFPPVKVMHDGENYWLYDGFHRVQAARQIGRETIKADVEQGTKEDAQWASLAANKRHGLRRSQEDKRRAIKRAGPELQRQALEEVKTSSKKMYDTTMAGLNSAATYGSFYHGKPGMQSITGIFRRNYRWSISKARMTGRVGFLSAKAARSAFYAKWFFYGSENQPARPVHDDAFEANREPYIKAQSVALRAVLARLQL